MALVSWMEVLDLIIMIAAVAFIFKDYFPVQKDKWSQTKGDFWLSVYVTAPSIVFHELAHKFVGLLLGMQAVFHAAYTWLGIGILLKLVNFPFIFFVPGYVSISGADNQLYLAATAFAGPFLNLVLWLGALGILSNKKWTKKINKTTFFILNMTKQMNMLLFILNMLPIPGLDGFSVYYNFYQYLF